MGGAQSNNCPQSYLMKVLQIGRPLNASKGNWFPENPALDSVGNGFSNCPFQTKYAVEQDRQEISMA